MANSFKVSILSIICLVFLLPQFAYSKTSAIGLDWTSGLKKGKTATKKNLNFSTPIVIGDTIYVGNSGGYLYSLDLTSGKKKWDILLEGPVRSSPAYDAGTLYLGDGKGNAYAINAVNGEVFWKVFIGEEVMSTPAIDENSIFILTQMNSMIAIDKQSGAVKWRERRPIPFASLSIMAAANPVIIDDKIYAGNSDGVLVVYSKDGRKLKIYPMASGKGMFVDIDTTPLKVGDVIYVSTMEGALYALNYKTGKDVWVRQIATPNNITRDGDILYVTSVDKVYALRQEDGKIVWEKSLNVDQMSAATISSKYVIVVSTSDKFYVLDKVSGDIVLERHLGGGTFGSPVFVGGRVLILSNGGNLYAFRIND